jgi:hypothetical protein
MSWEPRIVKTVNLDYDKLLVIESPHGAPICVIHGGVVLVACRPVMEKSAGRREASNWSLRRLPILGWRLLRTLRERTQWTKPRQWAPT